jgi:hypothetical protein
MALNGFYYEELWAYATNTTFTESATVNFGPSYVRAATALQNVSEPGAVGVAIVEFVQNGTPYHGFWQEINGPGITSVTVALTVTNAYGQGTLNIDIFS